MSTMRSLRHAEAGSQQKLQASVIGTDLKSLL